MLTMKGENMEELTTAESMVMKTIWDHPHEMALQEIMKLTNETYGKDWKSQTVSTYIAKLVKQFLTAFYKDHKLTKEEIEELRKSIDELDQ